MHSSSLTRQLASRSLQWPPCTISSADLAEIGPFQFSPTSPDSLPQRDSSLATKLWAASSRPPPPPSAPVGFVQHFAHLFFIRFSSCFWLTAQIGLSGGWFLCLRLSFGIEVNASVILSPRLVWPFSWIQFL